MGKQSRQKRERRAAPPPVGKNPHGWRPSRWLLAIGGAALVAAIAGGLAVALGQSGGTGPTSVTLGPTVANMAALPGLQTGQPPWPAEQARLAARLDALGLPRLQMEGNVVHIHQHLDVYANGRHLTVPAQIGIDSQQRYLDPIHTHDASGIIHIESPSNTNYTLGQFFAVWGLRLNSHCIGGLCTSGSKQLHTWVNGKPVTGDPARIVLAPHQEIVLAYGTRAQQPSHVPSSYRFAAGL
jgi:hypothetical protein